MLIATKSVYFEAFLNIKYFFDKIAVKLLKI